MFRSWKIVCTVLCVMAIVIAIIPYFFQPVNVSVPQKDSPVYFNESINCFLSIDQISNNEQYIFLLDKYRGYLRVFDINGNYINTLAFADSPNGTFQMAAFENLLYVRAPNGDLYSIQNCEFVEYIDRDDSMEIFDSLDFSQESKTYEARRGGVWDVSGDEDHIIIPIKGYTFLSNTDSRIIPIIFISLLIALIRITPQKKSKLNNSYITLK